MVVFQLMIPSFRFIKSQRIRIRTSSANITIALNREMYSGVLSCRYVLRAFTTQGQTNSNFPPPPKVFLIQNTMQFYSKKKKKTTKAKGLLKITFQICKSLVLCETPCPAYKDIFKRVPTFHKGVKITQILHFQSCFPNILNP